MSCNMKSSQKATEVHATAGQTFFKLKNGKSLQLSADLFFLYLQLSAWGAFSALSRIQMNMKWFAAFCMNLLQLSANWVPLHNSTQTTAAIKLFLPLRRPVAWLCPMHCQSLRWAEKLFWFYLSPLENISNTSASALWSLLASTENSQWAERHTRQPSGHLWLGA